MRIKKTERIKGINTDRSNHSNHNQTHNTGTAVLPLPPVQGEEASFEMEIYARFMSHLRQVPATRMAVKILSAIQFTADILDHSDALVAKMLVDMGLRASRKAFPAAFLEFADKTLARAAWEPAAALPAIVALKRHWDDSKISSLPFTGTGGGVRREGPAYYKPHIPSPFIPLSALQEGGEEKRFILKEDV